MKEKMEIDFLLLQQLCNSIDTLFCNTISEKAKIHQLKNVNILIGEIKKEMTQFVLKKEAGVL